MPIEIRQMIVKARITPQGAAPSRAGVPPKDDCDCAQGLTADDLARLLSDREER
jgi:hypothetical protein